MNVQEDKSMVYDLISRDSSGYMFSLHIDKSTKINANTQYFFSLSDFNWFHLIELIDKIRYVSHWIYLLLIW